MREKIKNRTPGIRLKIGRFIRHHKIVIVITIVCIVYACGKAVGCDLAAKGVEVSIEPMIDVALEKFCQDTAETV